MDLYLVRHAQSQNNALPERLRVADPGLTELGHEQAARLAERVRSLQLTRLITSPFRRALETTEHLRSATGLVPEVRVALHETGGCMEGVEPATMVGQPGLSREQILAEFRDYQIEPSLDGDGWWQCQPYETVDRARLRAAQLLAATQAEFAHTRERVAFVMHGDFQLLFLRRFHSIPLVLALNASVTHVHLTPDQTELIEFNSVAHLTDEMVSW
jgi:2,3-bisphosphoglycerate-dependent phosphoglycerate mutase